MGFSPLLLTELFYQVKLLFLLLFLNLELDQTLTNLSVGLLRLFTVLGSKEA